MARKAGGDGNPRFVDALEELGIGDSESDERHHNVEPTHGRNADGDEFVAGGEGTKDKVRYDKSE